MSSINQSTASPENPRKLSSVADSDDNLNQTTNPGERGKKHPSLGFMDFFFEESTTPPLEDLETHPNSKHNSNNTGSANDLSPTFREIRFSSAVPPTESTSQSGPSLGNLSNPDLEQTELERALNEVNARHNYFNDSNLFGLHLSTSKDSRIHGSLASGLDQERTDFTPSASAGLQVDPSSVNHPRRHFGNSAGLLSTSSNKADQPNGATDTDVADIPVPALADKHHIPFHGTPVDIPVTSDQYPRPTNIGVETSPSVDTTPRVDKSTSQESETTPSHRFRPSHSWPNVIEVESDPEDETYRPGGKSWRNVDWDEEVEESFGESSETTEESSDSDSRLASTLPPSQPDLTNLAGKNTKGPTEPLSYHALSLRYAALEDYRKEYTSRTQKEINRLEDKVSRLKKTSIQKSKALRKLSKRLKDKERKITQILQSVQSELHAINPRLETAAKTDLYNQIRSHMAELAQRNSEVNILHEENVIHALIKFDLEKHLEKLQAKVRRLESDPSSLFQSS